jgi:hypothetical protein
MSPARMQLQPPDDNDDATRATSQPAFNATQHCVIRSCLCAIMTSLASLAPFIAYIYSAPSYMPATCVAQLNVFIMFIAIASITACRFNDFLCHRTSSDGGGGFCEKERLAPVAFYRQAFDVGL